MITEVNIKMVKFKSLDPVNLVCYPGHKSWCVRIKKHLGGRLIATCRNVIVSVSDSQFVIVGSRDIASGDKEAWR